MGLHPVEANGITNGTAAAAAADGTHDSNDQQPANSTGPGAASAAATPGSSAAASTGSTGATGAASQLPGAALELAAKLFDLARAGDNATLQQYVSAGIPPNLTNHAGDTILMLAAYHGHAATVQMLLAAGADPNVVNDRGQSPLAGAVFKGHDDVVRALFSAGADVNAGHPTAVDCARMFRRDEILTLFGAQLGDGSTLTMDQLARAAAPGGTAAHPPGQG